MDNLKIDKVTAREILDSRGNPTVEAEVTLCTGARGRGAVPSGASTGEFEALEKRDGDKKRYNGKGVLSAVGQVNTAICQTLSGMNGRNLYELDEAMRHLDGTEDKSNLGANAILSVSMASARAAANHYGLPLFAWLGGVNANRLPVPMMNILNGGAHASNTVDTQEFMILPIGADNFREALRWGAEVYHALSRGLKAKGLSTAVGDEGGFAPDVRTDEEALDTIMAAISDAGFEPGKDIALAMDAAASEWKSPAGLGHYQLPKAGAGFTSGSLIDHWEKLLSAYPIVSLEDGLDEEDWQGWQEMTRRLGNRCKLVGDDLFVTNSARLSKGISMGAGNAILIKPNQIGSLSETMETVKLAHRRGFTAITSHRSGETEDTTIADLSVALGTALIKTGAPCRSERVSKYNRLARIEECLGTAARYWGREAVM